MQHFFRAYCVGHRPQRDPFRCPAPTALTVNLRPSLALANRAAPAPVGVPALQARTRPVLVLDWGGLDRDVVLHRTRRYSAPARRDRQSVPSGREYPAVTLFRADPVASTTTRASRIASDRRTILPAPVCPPSGTKKADGA